MLTIKTKQTIKNQFAAITLFCQPTSTNVAFHLYM